MSTSDDVGGRGNNQKSEDVRAEWERPVLHRLAANKAAGGGNPGNDGQGVGPGSHQQHS